MKREYKLFFFFLNSIRDIWNFRFLSVVYVQLQLKLRYRRSILGYLWSVLAPLLNYMLLGFVFKVIIKGQKENFFPYYILGASVFTLITSVLNRAPSVFLANENFIKKVNIPKIIYVSNMVFYEVFNYILCSIALILILTVFGGAVSTQGVFFSMIVLLLLLVFLFGCVALISVIAVYFRDVFYILPVALQGLFFATPIVYSDSILPPKYLFFARLNPLYYYVKNFRDPLLGEPNILFSDFAVMILLSLFSFFIGIIVIRYNENKIVFKL